MASATKAFVRQPYVGSPEEMESIFRLRQEVLGEPIERSRAIEEEFTSDASTDRVVNAAAFDSEGNALAAGHISEDDRVGEWMLRYICVAEGHRGQGLGTELVEYLAHAALQRGAKIIEVKARQGDPEATENSDRQTGSVDFYRRLGFTAATPSYFRHGIQHLRMSKRLPGA